MKSGKNKSFFILWLGIGVSILGSELTEFAIGLWMLKDSMSVTSYTFLYVFLELPILLLAPFAGFIIDKYDKRKVLLYAEITSGLLSLILLLIYYLVGMEAIFVYLYIAACGFLTSLQIDGYATIIYRLVPKEKLSRANALGSLTESLPQMLTPVLGALLFFNFGLNIVLSIDILTFIISSLSVLSLFRLSKIKFIDIHSSKNLKINWKSILPSNIAIEYITNNKFILTLTYYSFIKNMAVSTLFVSIVPFFYQNTIDKNMVGIMMSIGGISMVLVSILSSIHVNISRKIPLLVLDMIFCFGIIVIPFGNGYLIYSLAVIMSFASLRLSLIKLQTIWHCSVNKSEHGRVFAVRNLAKKIGYMVSYLSVGFIIEILIRNYSDKAYIVFYTTIGSIFLFILTYLNIKAIQYKNVANQKIANLNQVTLSVDEQ